MVVGTGPRSRGPYAKSETTRLAILDAALQVFAQSGYRSGSLREVAERVGMSEAGLLHHYPNKSLLLQAVLDRRDELARTIVPIGAEDGIETLNGMVELVVRNAATPGAVELYCTLSAEATSPDHPAHEFFRRRYEYVRGAVVEAFEDLRRRGLLREDVTPLSAGIALVALMDGLQVQWLLDRDTLDMAEEVRAALRRLTTAEF